MWGRDFNFIFDVPFHTLQHNRALTIVAFYFRSHFITLLVFPTISSISLDHTVKLYYYNLEWHWLYLFLHCIVCHYLGTKIYSEEFYVVNFVIFVRINIENEFKSSERWVSAYGRKNLKHIRWGILSSYAAKGWYSNCKFSDFVLFIWAQKCECL